MNKFTQFGPSTLHNVPSGGFCISVFAILTNSGKVLLVKPKQHGRWMEEWAPNWGIYEKEQVKREMKSWRFPSSYVVEGEAPEKTLERIMRDQLGLSQYKVLSSKLLNFYDPSRRYPGRMHWDYCFVFRVSSRGVPKIMPWFSDVKYIKIRDLKEVEFGSAQEYLAQALFK